MNPLIHLKMVPGAYYRHRIEDEFEVFRIVDIEVPWGMSLGSLKQGGDQQGDYWSVRSGSASCFSAILLGWSGGLRA